MMERTTATSAGPHQASAFTKGSVLFLGIVSVSCAAILIKFCPEVPALMIAFHRLGMASIIMLCALAATGRLRLPSRKETVYCFLGGFFLSLHFATWVTSLKFTSVACSVALVTMNPIFVGVLSYLLFREKSGPALIAGIALSVSGSMVLAYGDAGSFKGFFNGSNAVLGDFLALCGALAASSYLITGSRARPHMDILTYVTWVYTICSLFLLLFIIVLGIPFATYSTDTYGILLLMALIPQILGHSSLNWALAHMPASMVSLSILGEPVGATLLAYWLLGEKVSLLQVTGIALILGGIAVATLRNKPKPDAIV